MKEEKIVKPARLNKHQQRVRTVLAVYAILERDYAKVDYDAGEVIGDVYSVNLIDYGFKVYPTEWDLVDTDFKAVCVKALTERTKIEEAINKYLDGWSFDRLPMVTQAILLVSYAEAVIVACTPKAVAVNEALIILKELSSHKEARYVNAVLERSISEGLGIETDYKGPGKIHVDESDLEPDSETLKAVLSGEAVKEGE